WPLWLHAVTEEFTYRHRWSTGDLVIWDNRSVMHTAILDYDEPRSMSRIVIQGIVPV
ncbi:MAG TPA: TauD/TfdA family dioxygenase, partial [Pseudomonadales bacterium]|nr:TauD/TfdA family dioxygenase [Pseudomonadales bacterium]